MMQGRSRLFGGFLVCSYADAGWQSALFLPVLSPALGQPRWGSFLRRLTTAAECRLLEMLAASEDEYDAYTEALLMGHGFMHPLIADVVDAWFAAAKTERIVAGEEAVEITRFRIPDAGRCGMWASAPCPVAQPAPQGAHAGSPGARLKLAVVRRIRAGHCVVRIVWPRSWWNATLVERSQIAHSINESSHEALFKNDGARPTIVGCSTETGSDAGKVFLRASSSAASWRRRLPPSPSS
jgi:hypothetical protein